MVLVDTSLFLDVVTGDLRSALAIDPGAPCASSVLVPPSAGAAACVSASPLR
jgi:hypothetical protein